MITIKIEGVDGVLKMLGKAGKQARWALADSMTQTMNDVEKATYAEFNRVFDRPAPLTMKSMFTTRATERKLESAVLLKNRPIGGKNRMSMAEIIGHQFTGGTRKHKALEKLLTSYNFMKSGEFVVPGAAAKLDRYGNMNKGQIQQIISQLKIRRLGFDQAATESKRSKRNQMKAGSIFWSYGKDGGRVPLVDKELGITYGWKGGNASRLPKGAWVRAGRSVKPLLIVVSSTSYRQRIDLEKIASPVIAKQLNIYFAQEMRNRMARSA